MEFELARTERDRVTVAARLSEEDVLGKAHIMPRLKPQAKRRTTTAPIKGVVANPKLHGRVLVFASGISCVLVSPEQIDDNDLAAGVTPLCLTKTAKKQIHVEIDNASSIIKGEVKPMTKDEFMKSVEHKTNVPKGYLSSDNFLQWLKDTHRKNKRAIFDAKKAISHRR